MNFNKTKWNNNLKQLQHSLTSASLWDMDFEKKKPCSLSLIWLTENRLPKKQNYNIQETLTTFLQKRIHIIYYALTHKRTRKTCSYFPWTARRSLEYSGVGCSTSVLDLQVVYKIVIRERVFKWPNLPRSQQFIFFFILL